MKNLFLQIESTNDDNVVSANDIEIETDNRSNDPGKWKKMTKEDVSFWIKCGPEQCQNQSGSFNASRRLYNQGTKSRFCTENMFYGKKPNGERYRREWLIYSPTTGRVYCFACKLFSSEENSNKLFNDGFNDWKNSALLQQHENGPLHRDCMLT